MIKVRSNTKAVRDDVRRAKLQLARFIDKRASELNAQALGMLVVGLEATIYETEEGNYRRSHDLARGAQVSVRTTRRGVVEVRVWNTEPYAAAVEWGTYDSKTTLQAGVARAERPGAQPTPLVTGRSGVNWTQPSLAHTRALMWTLLRLRLDAKAAWYWAWKG
ncbi:hypothetical protein [Deinococcus wulumuqiensis]|uniref:hypothetical protein n=1 Tax=Deinococcus wulumuqiensis TaxID=980427 RepID=UPI0024330B2A|nr:hypothetical protein [Deinococcus wulumuqiensis]